jgi:acetyl-CoA carboxylase biotin carboxyl carrier protein
MDIKMIEELVNVIDKSSMLEFSIKEGNTRISMSRRGVAGQPGEPFTAVSIAPAIQQEEIDDELYITSPIVGTFYSSPSPDAKAFVYVGDVVKAGQTICILEAMKMMNEIEAEYECEIEAILVSNEQKVEYGQPLFRVKKL